MSEKVKPSVAAGCVQAILGIFVCAPIWYVLLGRVLYATNAQTLDWVLYWVYVPTALLAVIAGHLAKLMQEADSRRS